MNKTQLACLLVTILIVFTAGAWLHGRSHHRHYVLAHGRMIGEELIANTNSTKVVHLGSNLRLRLVELLRSPSKVEAVNLGDAPVGDGRADVWVALGNHHGLRLGIRIKQAEEYDKFHILGYWTISEGDSATH